MAHTPSEAAPDAPDATLHDPARRDFLYLVTGSVAAVGAAVTLWPFIDQMNPDAATIAAAGPVDIDISQIQEGQRMVTLWAARPVFIVRRPGVGLEGAAGPEAPLASSATPIPTIGSSRNTPRTGTARSSRNSWFWSASAPISAASRCSTPSPTRRNPAPDWLGGFLPLPRLEIRSRGPGLPGPRNALRGTGIVRFERCRQVRNTPAPCKPSLEIVGRPPKVTGDTVRVLIPSVAGSASRKKSLRSCRPGFSTK